MMSDHEVEYVDFAIRLTDKERQDHEDDGSLNEYLLRKSATALADQIIYNQHDVIQITVDRDIMTQETVIHHRMYLLKEKK